MRQLDLAKEYAYSLVLLGYAPIEFYNDLQNAYLTVWLELGWVELSLDGDYLILIQEEHLEPFIEDLRAW